MVTDGQVIRLWRALISGKTLAQSADMANMDEKERRPNVSSRGLTKVTFFRNSTQDDRIRSAELLSRLWSMR